MYTQMIKNKVINENYEVGVPYNINLPKVDCGSFEVDALPPVRGTGSVIKIKYTLDCDIAQNGGVTILARNGQTKEPDGEFYLQVNCSNPNVKIKIVSKSFPRAYITTPDTIYHNVYWHAATVTEGNLQSGDVLEFILGTEKHPWKFINRASNFSSDKEIIKFYIDKIGSNEYIELLNSPVISAPFEKVEKLLYSKNGKGATFDKFGNVVKHNIELELIEETNQNGCVRKKYLDPETKLTVNAHPEKKQEEYEILWGDIHFHSYISNDVMTQGVFPHPKEEYTFARDVKGLDFAALTDHNEPVLRSNIPMLERGIGQTEELWEVSKDITDSFYDKGAFTTFFGFEYRNQRGDTLVYVKDKEKAPLISGHLDSIDSVHQYCKNLEFFTAPHLHPYSQYYLTLAGWKFNSEVIDKWSVKHGDNEPIIEIFSNHGRYEFYNNQPHLSKKYGNIEGNSVQAHLMRGQKFGIYGGSDDHTGHPGETGLMALYAKSNSREDIFEAIKSRRCYATTNARIILEFKVNGKMMGSEDFTNDYNKISGTIHGTEKIVKVDIIRDSFVFKSYEPNSIDFSFEYEDNMRMLGTGFYYLRILQSDNHMAWSSPVWVTTTYRIEDMHHDFLV